jgi:tetratricopeptide (TPR) repeat protein
MTSFRSDDTPAAWYAALCSRLGREPDATACVEWAHTHPTDPEAYLALAEAGHLWAEQHHHERALDLYEQAQALRPRATGWLTACIVEQLFELGREAKARAAIDALHRHLQADPEPDAFAYAEMADLLYEVADDPADALRWCEEGLQRYHQDARVDDASPDELTLRLWNTRLDLRNELGLEPDALDQAVEARLAGELRDLITASQDRRLRWPAGTGMELFWPEDAFTAVQQRWPALVAETADYRAYCRGIEASAHQAAESGVARVVLAATPVADYEAYATDKNHDPSLPYTRTAFAEDRGRRYLATAIPWPPPRNGPCWCGSGRKYKKCCGEPRHQ